MQLDRDFKSSGPLYNHVRATFGLSDREFRQVVANTAAAADILRNSCKAGRLRFDIEPEEFLLTGSVATATPECELP